MIYRKHIKYTATGSMVYYVASTKCVEYASGEQHLMTLAFLYRHEVYKI